MIQLRREELQHFIDDVTCLLSYAERAGNGSDIAWQDVVGDIGEDIWASLDRFRKKLKHSYTFEFAGRTIQVPPMPVYDKPRVNKWQGLTDDEIIDTANNAPFDTMVSAEDYIYVIARAIEKSLKEKNT